MDVSLIKIEQDIPGFNNFIGSWVIQGDINIVIDSGPANTAGRLIDSLSSMGLDRLDYILLTHIHIDHAGALAELLDRYPRAKVICHEKGMKFLADPSKLWAGSLDVLGKVAGAFGRPGPVPRERLIPHRENPLKELLPVETPGHAPHHLSFSYGNRLFAGEAGGNYYSIKGDEYMRPATPPKFFFEVCLSSVDRMLALEDQPICYTHCGGADSSHRLLNMFREQLVRWKDIIRQLMESREHDKDLVERCIDTLLEKDPCMKAFSELDPDSQNRERFFLANSVKGYIGFLREGGA
ncbi:MAG: MBL fold metallo-hydrolase [Desulfobacterales bacterium]|nr:MBL fold metallo-hydrolase [Desulfobacterales bacterium]